MRFESRLVGCLVQQPGAFLKQSAQGFGLVQQVFEIILNFLPHVFDTAKNINSLLATHLNDNDDEAILPRKNLRGKNVQRSRGQGAHQVLK